MDSDSYAIFGIDLPPIAVPEGLSPAEAAVVRAIAEGKSNAAIAKQRRTSVNTVANQVRSIFAKLRVGSRLELVELLYVRPRDGAPRPGQKPR